MIHLEYLVHLEFGGCINILERGSTHIEFQKDILREEYDLLGLNFELGVLMRRIAKNVHELEPTKHSKYGYLH